MRGLQVRERTYIHVYTQITTFLNADRDVDLSGAKTADAVPSRHQLLPFDNREGASLSSSSRPLPCLNSECAETGMRRMWEGGRVRKKKMRHNCVEERGERC